MLEANMKVAVLGCGNMASTVVNSMYDHNKDISFLTYTPSFTKAQELAQKVCGVACYNLNFVEDVDYILIGCKPFQFDDLAKNLQKYDLSNKVIVSIMASVPIEYIAKKLKTKKIVRLMPSMTMQFNQGTCLVSKSLDVLDDDLKYLTQTLSHSSTVFSVSTEELFEKLTVITSSGPALIYYLFNSLKESLRLWGLDDTESNILVIDLFKGSTNSLENSLGTEKSDISNMINSIKSSKGITQELLSSVDGFDIKGHIMKSIYNAASKSKEITIEKYSH